MRRYVRFMLLLVLGLLALLFCSVSPAFFQPEPEPVVFARVWNKQDAYIMSFTAGAAGGNTIFSAQSLPMGSIPASMSISSNGQWTFARQASRYGSLVYAKLGQPFRTFPVTDLRASFSADAQYAFYISVDSLGLYETYNLLNLQTGWHVEFLVEPLSQPVPTNTLPTSFPQYARPIEGWTLKTKHLTMIDDHYVFFTVDLSNIDWTRNGTYPLVKGSPISAIGGIGSNVYQSADGRYFAYAYYGSSDSRLHIAIHDIDTRRSHILPIETSLLDVFLFWGSDSTTLYYGKNVDGGLDIFQFDLLTQRSKPLPIRLPMNSTQDVLICGSFLFYVEYSRLSSVIYSVSLENGYQREILRASNSIQLLSCAPGYFWNTRRVAVCDPFCTPTPKSVVGRRANVRALDLAGGDIVNGRLLYTAFGCIGCHNGSTAPDVEGTYTRIVDKRLKELKNANMTPEQYIAQSIVKPSDYVAPDFNDNVMPKDWGDVLDLQELRDIVAYLMGQKSKCGQPIQLNCFF